MPKSELPELLAHTRQLISEQCWNAAYLHARHALQQARTGLQAAQVLQVCRQVPDEQRLVAPWVSLVAFTAFRANDLEVCEAHLCTKAVGLEALRAWTLMLRGDFAGALAYSETALAGEFAGLAWWMRAWALVKLDRPGWAEAYQQAAGHNEGRQRGLCLLHLGAYLTHVDDNAGARSAYAEAAPCFPGDPELRANALYNVGIACLRLQKLDDAQRAYEEAMVWARKPDGAPMLACAWVGLGQIRRVRREFPRALYAYEMAQSRAQDADDVAGAWRGKAHTLRLLGRLDEALTTLHEGLERLHHPEQHEIYADLAALRATLGDEVGALQALARTLPGQIEEAQRALVVRAELARQRGDTARATTLLRELKQGALWTAEEAYLLPDLFALIGVQAAPYEPMRVQVSADGPVRALLNDRPLHLHPKSPAASLLALLVTHFGNVEVERALEDVDLKGETSRRQRQNLSRALDELRQVFGWPEVVQTDGQLLRLDPQAEWLPLIYPPQERSDAFCFGLHDEWIRMWRQLKYEPGGLILL